MFHLTNLPCVGISVDDLEAAVARFETFNVPFAKRIPEPPNQDMAFMLDPDGYMIEVLQNEVIKPRAHW